MREGGREGGREGVCAKYQGHSPHARICSKTCTYTNRDADAKETKRVTERKKDTESEAKIGTERELVQGCIQMTL